MFKKYLRAKVPQGALPAIDLRVVNPPAIPIT
jgi:hypothetical protein